MENTKYGKRREGRWTPIRVKAQDTRANPNSWETHLVRKRLDIGLLRALSLWIMMMMNCRLLKVVELTSKLCWCLQCPIEDTKFNSPIEDNRAIELKVVELTSTLCWC